MTRQHIIEMAGRRRERDGINCSVAALMKDAGLTNGAFCTHFASEDELVATAVADPLHALNANIVAHGAPGRDGLEQIVRRHLSTRHRNSPDSGCPSAAPLDETGRRADPTKQACADGVLVVIDGIAARGQRVRAGLGPSRQPPRLAPDDPRSARSRALSACAMTAGTRSPPGPSPTRDSPTSSSNRASATPSSCWAWATRPTRRASTCRTRPRPRPHGSSRSPASTAIRARRRLPPPTGTAPDPTARHPREQEPSGVT